MKFLFITRIFPHDLSTLVHGVLQRMRMFIDAMKEIASIEMLIFVRPDIDISDSLISNLEHAFLEHWNVNIKVVLCPLAKKPNNGNLYAKIFSHVKGACNFFLQSNSWGTSGPEQLEAFESCLRRKPDAIFVHRLYAMNPLSLTREPLPPVFFDLDDIEHIAYKRQSCGMPKLSSRLLSYSQLPQLFLGELRAIRLAQKTFVCSEEDGQYLSSSWRQKGIVVIPNAINIPSCQPFVDEPSILFLGSFLSKPNIDGAEFLVSRVFPEISKVIPDARLIVAGLHPEKIPSFSKALPQVEFTGFVEDLEGLYQKTRIVCAPIFSGSGTRVKIIEAAVYGKPIVATRIGAEGLCMQDGVEILLRDDLESFVQACLSLLNERSWCERLGKAAREKAIMLYDRKNVVPLIQEHLKPHEADLGRICRK